MVKTYRHICSGTCSRYIELTYDDESMKILNCLVFGGCPGNTRGVSKLVEGKTLDEVYKTLIGIPCGNRGTSCPNELALAAKEILEQR